MYTYTHTYGLCLVNNGDKNWILQKCLSAKQLLVSKERKRLRLHCCSRKNPLTSDKAQYTAESFPTGAFHH